MREAIEQLIADYERRINSAYDLMTSITNKEQYNRVNGKVEAYRGFIRELKEVLADGS